MHAASARTMFLHSSNEMYGADKILLEILQALPDDSREKAVVCIPDDLPPGDGRLAAALSTLGVSATTFGLPVLRRRYLSMRGLFPLLGRLWKTFGLLRDSKPDVVYCTTSAMVLCLPLAWLAGVKMRVLHVQEIWAGKERRVLGFLGRAANRIICISSASHDSMPRFLTGRANLMVNAHQDSGKMLVSRPPGTPLRFVVASRWNAWKGHRTLLEAWDAESAPGELIILGGPPPIGEGVDVPGLVANLRHPDSVSVIGEVAAIDVHIDDADFLILPSDSPEPFGLVVLEAFARGRPVIASRAGGVLDVVTDGFDGRLYEIGNAEALRSILQSVDRQQAIQMGLNARKTYEQKFSIVAYRKRFAAFWETVSETCESSEHAHR
jgi:glycosyltransferase involved in cell wall biosynthesis